MIYIVYHIYIYIQIYCVICMLYICYLKYILNLKSKGMPTHQHLWQELLLRMNQRRNWLCYIPWWGGRFIDTCSNK